MSYAIVRNEKLTRDEAKGRYIHNERKTRGHTNKDIIQEKTHLNYYLKKNEMSYIKEFDKIRKENNLQGFIKSNSIIMCEMIFTSDKEFFDKIGEEETKRYFQESYKFVCNYKNLGEQNIISAVVHLDEGTPHMHLLYIPVVNTKDKEGKTIDKICCRDFWKGRDSYRQLQNSFFEDITAKGFTLERGLPIEETGAKHEKIEAIPEKNRFLLDSNKIEILKEIYKINGIMDIDLQSFEPNNVPDYLKYLMATTYSENKDNIDFTTLEYIQTLKFKLRKLANPQEMIDFMNSEISSNKEKLQEFISKKQMQNEEYSTASFDRKNDMYNKIKKDLEEKLNEKIISIKIMKISQDIVEKKMEVFLLKNKNKF